MHSPVCRGNAKATSIVVRRSLNTVVRTVYVPGPCLRSWPLWFSASEAFDGTAVVIRVISSAPHALSDHRESMEPSWCQDYVFGTIVCQVLDRTHTLAQLPHLICLLVWDSQCARLWSMCSGCPLHNASLLHPYRGWWCVLPDVISQVTWKASVSLSKDSGCAAVEKSPYAFYLAISVLDFVNYVCRFHFLLTECWKTMGSWFLNFCFDCP